jgi:dTDP-4-amino-4,6-dideoxygalactose transaminase
MLNMMDLKRYAADNKADIQKLVDRVILSGWYVLGQECANFESKFANYIGVPHAVGVGSGTDAIQIALMSLGIGRGDEVITVGNTAIPTVSAIRSTGANPVFVDIDPETGLMDVSLLPSLINKKTKAVIPVHLYGQMVDMPAVMDIADAHEIKVIEDACQAHGAEWEGKKSGSFGHLGCFSFYPTKNLGGIGDGGAVVTTNPALADICKKIRNYGQTDRYYCDIEGINSRLDEIHAAFLSDKLDRLDQLNHSRKQLALLYSKGLSENTLITPLKVQQKATHVFHLFVGRCQNRQHLQEALAKQGIQTHVHYPVPIYRQKAYKNLDSANCPHTDTWCDQVLSLPLYPEMGKEDIEGVFSALRQIPQPQPQ